MIASSLFVGGEFAVVVPLQSDLSLQKGENLEVELVTEPVQPIAGQKTML